MANFLIGKHQFDLIHNWPDLPSEKYQLEQRAAVDGTGIWPAGKKARPFEVRTVEAVASLAAAEAKFRDYRKTVDEKKMITMTKDGIKSQSVKVKPLDVRRTRSRANKTMVGFDGVADGGDGVKLECVWTLIAVLI